MGRWTTKVNKKKIVNDFLMGLRSYNKWNITKKSNKARFEDLKNITLKLKS